MQKVTVLLNEKGVPEMGELVTQSVIEAVCQNFNALMNKGLVVVQIDYQEQSYQTIQDDYGILTSMKYPMKPAIRAVSSPLHGSALQILMPS